MEYLRNYIDGALEDPQTGVWLPVYEPATGVVYAMAPDSAGADVDAAVDAAQRAFRGWSTLPAEERSQHILRVAELIASRTG
jgi:aminomuconate-semialdehyde/2-hydroxymuconate-6-semialdehyde dehydrogenase